MGRFKDWWTRAFPGPGPQPSTSNEDRMLDRIPGFNYDNTFYPLGGSGVGYPDTEQDNSNSFQIATNNIYKANSFVFAVMDFRRSVFNQIDFVYKKRNVKAGERPRPGDVFDGPGLKILEEPWPGANTSDLLSRMINDVDLCGNSYVIRRSRDRLQRLSPDSVTVIFGSKMSTTNPRVMPDAEIIGYVYSPRESPEVEEYYLPEEMCHWAPLADPSLQSLGMTWLEPLMKDVDTDQSLQTHVIAYLRNGANPGTVLTFDPGVDEEKARRFLTQFQNRHQGVTNAYKTLVLGGGATEVSKISADLNSLSINHLTSVTESRVAAAGGVHPMLLGTESALKHGSFNAIQAARRVFADRTMRPLWRSLVENLSTIVDVPKTGRLWYDDTNVPFLREDTSDRVRNLQTYAITMRQMQDSGWLPDTVKEAMITENLDVLEHSGLIPVQVRPDEGEDGNVSSSFFPQKGQSGSFNTGGSSSSSDSDDSGDGDDDDRSSQPVTYQSYHQGFEYRFYDDIRAEKLKAENRRLKAELENRRLQLETKSLTGDEDAG